MISTSRFSVLLPNLRVPICVIEPIGLEIPFRIANVPAINVVLTAPKPGIRTPNLPLADSIFTLKLKDYEKISKKEKLSWEKQLLGLYLSDHPFKEKVKLLKNNITTLNNLKSKEEQIVRVAGTITKVEKIITRRGQAMLFISIEDSTDIVELLIFPKLLENTLDLWQDEKEIMVTGKVSTKDGQIKILAETAQELKEEYLNKLEIKERQEDKLWFNLPASFDQEKMRELKNIIKEYPGLTSVYLNINNGKVRRVKTELKVSPKEELINKIKESLGQKSCFLEKD